MKTATVTYREELHWFMKTMQFEQDEWFWLIADRGIEFAKANEQDLYKLVCEKKAYWTWFRLKVNQFCIKWANDNLSSTNPSLRYLKQLRCYFRTDLRRFCHKAFLVHSYDKYYNHIIQS